MVNASRLLEMARKWKKIAILGRKRLSWTPKNSFGATNLGTTIADKGHFFVYTVEGKRFMVPLALLSNTMFEEMLGMSEEEFGLPKSGPITLPCNAIFLEFALSVLRSSKNVDNELLMSSFRRHCSRSIIQDVEKCQQLLVF